MTLPLRMEVQLGLQRIGRGEARVALTSRRLFVGRGCDVFRSALSPSRTIAYLALVGREAAEIENLHLVSLNELRTNRPEHTLNLFARLCLRDTALLRYDGHERASLDPLR